MTINSETNAFIEVLIELPPEVAAQRHILVEQQFKRWTPYKPPLLPGKQRLSLGDENIIIIHNLKTNIYWRNFWRFYMHDSSTPEQWHDLITRLASSDKTLAGLDGTQLGVLPRAVVK